MRLTLVAICLSTCLAVQAFSQSIFTDQPAKPSAAPPLGNTSSGNASVTQPASRESATGTADQQKLPVPDAAALKEAIGLVNDVYGNDITAATTTDQKKAMVQKLLHTGNEEKGANRYALFITGKDVAIDAGDLAGCDAALDAIEASFEVDSPKLRSDAYTKIAPNVSLPAGRTMLCKGTSSAVRVAIAADRFDVAKSDADLGLRVARKSNDPTLVRQATADVQLARDTEAAYADIKKALGVLAEKPNNPDANLVVGKYRCFIKGEWTAGLPMLALGSDVTLKALAGQEIAGVTSADDKMNLGDEWWDVGGKEAGLAKQQIRSHAGSLYRQARPELSGLTKAKVEQRLKELEGFASGGPRATEAPGHQQQDEPPLVIHDLPPIASSPADGQLAAKDWMITCWDGIRWGVYPLTKATVEFDGATLSFKNTTGVWHQANLAFKSPINGDFSIELEYRGDARLFGLYRIDGADRRLVVHSETLDQNWHAFKMRRVDSELTASLDGKLVKVLDKAGEGPPFVGNFCIQVASGEEAEARNIRIKIGKPD